MTTQTPYTFSSMKTAHHGGAGFGAWAPCGAARDAMSGRSAVRTVVIDADRNLHALAERGAG